MAETVNELSQVVADETSAEEDSAEESVSELVEQVGRDAGTLVLRELELAGSRHMPALRRTGRDLALAAAAAAAFLTAFALANWAAVLALSSVLPDWLAPLVLAAAWAALGALLLFKVRSHTGDVLGTGWRRAVWGDPVEVIKEREQAREEAEAALRDRLDLLAEAIAVDAEERIRDAVVPVADGVIDAGEDLLEVADDLTDAIEDTVPGGGLLNRVLDLALLPGRVCVKVARTALARDGGTR